MPIISDSRFHRMVVRTGPFDGGRNGTRVPRPRATSGDVVLAFVGNALDGLGRVLDPILAVFSIGRKQTDHLIGAACGRTRDITGGKIDSLTHVVFVLQRPLHTQKCRPRPRSRLRRPTENPARYSTPPAPLESYIGT